MKGLVCMLLLSARARSRGAGSVRTCSLLSSPALVVLRRHASYTPGRFFFDLGTTGICVAKKMMFSHTLKMVNYTKNPPTPCLWQAKAPPVENFAWLPVGAVSTARDL